MEEEGQGRGHGDPWCHSVEGEDRKRVGQSEGPGKGALEGHSQGRAPGKGVLQTHWGVEGCGHNLGRTVVVVGMCNL